MVFRLGAPVAPLTEQASRAAGQVAAVVLLAVVLVLVLVDRRATRAARSLNEVSRFLARIATDRDAGSRVGLPAVAELARVTSAANRLRGKVEDHVAQTTRERDELAQLMDQVADGLMALTGDARILRINPAAKQLLGLAEVPPFAPVGAVVRDPLLRDLLEASVVRRESRQELAVGDREMEVRTKRGIDGGSVVLMVDITEIRRLEAVRSDFVANASHELKTPLTVIRGSAETILDEGLPGHLRRRFLRSIERNTVRLQRLVDDLLDLSRYESGGWRPERDPVSVSAVAFSAWDEHAREASKKGGQVPGEG